MAAKNIEKLAALASQYQADLTEIGEAYCAAWDSSTILANRLKAAHASLAWLDKVFTSDPDNYDRSACIGVLSSAISAATNGAVDNATEAHAVASIVVMGASGSHECTWDATTLEELGSLTPPSYLSYSVIRAFWYHGKVKSAPAFSLLERDRDPKIVETYRVTPGSFATFDALYTLASTGKISRDGVVTRIRDDAPSIMASRVAGEKTAEQIAKDEDDAQERDRIKARNKVTTTVIACKAAAKAHGQSILDACIDNKAIKRSDMLAQLALTPLSADELAVLFLHAGTRNAAMAALAATMVPKDAKPFLSALSDVVLDAFLNAIVSPAEVKAVAAA